MYKYVVLIIGIVTFIGSGLPAYASPFSDMECFGGEKPETSKFVGETLKGAGLLSKVWIGANNKELFCVEPLKDRPSIEFRRLNPTKYKILVKNISNGFPLVLGDGYSKGWKLYLVETSDSYVNAETDVRTKNSTSTWLGSDWLRKKGKFYETWFSNTVDTKYHWIANESFNAWWIDLQAIGYDSELEAEVGIDGAAVAVIVEYTPQRYYILGLFITVLTGFSLLSYLGWRSFKKKHV